MAPSNQGTESPLDESDSSRGAVYFSAGICMALVAFDSSPFRLDRWNGTHWLFDYEFGFIKRGLVGAVYQTLGLPITTSALLIVAVLVAITASWLWILYLVRILDESAQHSGGFLFIVWALTMPGSLQQFFYDLGRFDAFGGMAILFGLALLTARSPPRRSLVFITVLSVISILIHEAYYLWVAPTLLGAWAFTVELDRSNWVYLGIVYSALTALVVYVGQSTASDYVTQETFEQYLTNNGELLPHPKSVAVQFRSIGESINYNLRHGFTTGRLLGAVLSLASCLPALIVAHHTLDELAEEANYLWWQWAGCLATTALPLSLYLVGHDHGRWWAMSAFSLTALLCLLAIDDHDTILVRSFHAARRWLVLGIVFNLVLGPYGITSPFPLF